ncbi:hypothetical protein DNTS_000414 [Danionella cerebrum]|uniref:RNA polymerase II subunit M n=1 Tax=Danionella cerebrum TaxID=2873325 RepID=A0A553QZM3_9TELE|nr:hypothetical protein DNTS_000414 [Danionella translucida]
MLPSWVARQGDVGDLRMKNKDELLEILSRQEKLLSNKSFIHTLPDKGKKMTEFVEKVHLALDLLEEEERKQASLISVRTRLQSEYELALAKRSTDVSVEMSLPSCDVNKRKGCAAEEGSGDVFGQKDLARHRQTAETLEIVGVNTQASLMGDAELVEALVRVTLGESTSSDKSTSTFLGTPSQKKPHYIEVLEKTEESVHLKKPRFKPNQTVVKSESSSPSQPSGNTSPLTAEARRRQDRKHLDDVTAAKLPPLHHSPAQLLSLEESAALLHEQTRKQLELHARLSIRTENFSPEGGTLSAYKEVHDDGALLSSEED